MIFLAQEPTQQQQLFDALRSQHKFFTQTVPELKVENAIIDAAGLVIFLLVITVVRYFVRRRRLAKHVAMHPLDAMVAEATSRILKVRTPLSYFVEAGFWVVVFIAYFIGINAAKVGSYWELLVIFLVFVVRFIANKTAQRAYQLWFWIVAFLVGHLMIIATFDPAFGTLQKVFFVAIFGGGMLTADLILLGCIVEYLRDCEKSD